MGVEVRSRAPSGGFEPPHTAPEADALSPELRGLGFGRRAVRRAVRAGPGASPGQPEVSSSAGGVVGPTRPDGAPAEASDAIDVRVGRAVVVETVVRPFVGGDVVVDVSVGAGAVAVVGAVVAVVGA